MTSEAFKGADIKSEKDFMTILFDKEFENARCAYEGFGSFGIEKFQVPDPEKRLYNPRLLRTVLELCGYKGLADNLDNLVSRGVSPEKRRSINLDYMRFYTDIWNHENVGQDSLDFLKTTYFQPWMKRTSAFGMERINGGERLYLTNVEGKRLYLPDNIK